MLRTQINLREEQYHLLRIQAQREGESISELIRKLLDSAMRIKEKNNAYILLEMAKAAGKSGVKNLSANYKQVLYGGK